MPKRNNENLLDCSEKSTIIERWLRAAARRGRGGGHERGEARRHRCMFAACTIQFSYTRKNVMGEYYTKTCGKFITYTCGSSMDLVPRYLIATGANSRLYTIVGYSHANLSRVYREYPSRQLRALAHGQEKQRQRKGRIKKERERERCDTRNGPGYSGGQ